MNFIWFNYSVQCLAQVIWVSLKLREETILKRLGPLKGTEIA